MFLSGKMGQIDAKWSRARDGRTPADFKNLRLNIINMKFIAQPRRLSSDGQEIIEFFPHFLGRIHKGCRQRLIRSSLVVSRQLDRKNPRDTFRGNGN